MNPAESTSISISISVEPARSAGDPGAPRLRADVTAVLAVAGAVALAVAVAGPGGAWGDLAVLGACMVAGEMLAVQLTDGTALPLSLALILPLATAATGPGWAALAASGAALLCAPLRRGSSARGRLSVVAERGVAAAAAWGAQRAVTAVAPEGRGASVLSALVAAVAAVLVVELVARRLRGAEPFAAAGGYAAFFAVASSGLLMAVAYEGVGGQGAMGLWGVPVFAVPALSARWAFGRLHAIRRTYDQTLHVLSMVPEMGGPVL